MNTNNIVIDSVLDFLTKTFYKKLKFTQSESLIRINSRNRWFVQYPCTIEFSEQSLRIINIRTTSPVMDIVLEYADPDLFNNIKYCINHILFNKSLPKILVFKKAKFYYT